MLIYYVANLIKLQYDSEGERKAALPDSSSGVLMQLT